MAKFYYGGQAVVEGVMMRGRKTAAMAVRCPDRSVYLYEETLNPKLYQNRLFRLPFLRGMLLLWEMLVLGTRLMTMAANIASGAIDPSTPSAPPPARPDWPEPGKDVLEPRTGYGRGLPPPLYNAAEPPLYNAAEPPFHHTSEPPPLPDEAERPPQIGGLALALALVVSLGFAIAVFFLGPLLITSLFHRQIGEGWLNLTIEGVVRLALLVGYLYLIGRVPDIQRVFGYHGAEHKTINAMERGDPLDIPHVRRASRVHTRCGTGFLLLVMVVSIFVFALVGSPALPLKILSRIVLVPVVAGIAYELMRLGAANYRFRVVRWLLAPGLALQGLTTREPDDSMIECAIAALERVLSRDDQPVKTTFEVAST